MNGDAMDNPDQKASNYSNPVVCCVSSSQRGRFRELGQCRPCLGKPSTLKSRNRPDDRMVCCRLTVDGDKNTKEMGGGERKNVSGRQRYSRSTEPRDE